MERVKVWVTHVDARMLRVALTWLAVAVSYLSPGRTDKLCHQLHQALNLGTLGFQFHLLATLSYLLCSCLWTLNQPFTPKIMSRDACCYRIKCTNMFVFVLRRGVTSLCCPCLRIHECLCSAPAPGVLRSKVCTITPQDRLLNGAESPCNKRTSNIQIMISAISVH